MDLISPIPSLTDLCTPLFVDTNIVYQIDETKFPGLQESLHLFEPALIVDSDIPRNASNTHVELTDTCGDENQDLYNLIDSLDVEDTFLFPAESSVNILDLPEIQSELPTEEESACERKTDPFRSVFDAATAERDLCQLECAIGEFPESMSPNIKFHDSQPCDVMQSLTTHNACHQTRSCRFQNTMWRSKRKRHVSSAPLNNLTILNQREEMASSKRRKLDLEDLRVDTYPIDIALTVFTMTILHKYRSTMS